jgi:hypothetical protein
MCPFRRNHGRRQRKFKELLLVLRAPIESLLKQVPSNKPVYHTLTPAHIAATIQSHARRLGIEFATKDKVSHQVHNLGEGNDTDEDSSSALPSDDNPNDGLDFDAIRILESHRSCLLCEVRTIVSQPAHNSRVSKVTTLPCACALLPLALVVILARTIILPGRMLVSAKMPVLVLSVTHRKFVVFNIRMTGLPVMNPWSRTFSKPVTGLLIW